MPECMAQGPTALGRSADVWGRANAVRTASVTFPLTPTLSLGERENAPLAFSTTQRGVCSTNLPNNRTCRRFSLSPRERVRVRGSGGRSKKRSPELSNFASPPAEPKVSQDDWTRTKHPVQDATSE